MKKLPMMLQLALVLFCVMVIPTIIMTMYSGSQILGFSEKAIAESTLAGLESNQRLNESALNYITQDTVRLASSNLFDKIRHYQSYTQLNAEYGRVEHGLSILKELQRLVRSNEGVYSAYFYLQDSDYIISSDEGLTLLNRYESISWTEQATLLKEGIAGAWHPRKMESGEMVLSYILPLNRLSTAAKGMLVVNLKESQIGHYMDATSNDASRFTIIDGHREQIISHENKSLLLTNVNEYPVLAQLLGNGSTQGFQIKESNGERVLYTWKKSDRYDWIYVNEYSVDTLMSQSNAVQRAIIVFTIIIILVGTVVTLLIATWVSKPVRQLAGNIRARSNLQVAAKNELAFLDSAFLRMQEEEEKLHQIVTEHEQEATSVAVQHLLRGDTIKKSQMELLQEMFPHAQYKIIVISIDQYSQYVSKTSPEARSYHRYAFMSSCEQVLSTIGSTKCVYYGNDRIVVVTNFSKAFEHDQAIEGLSELLTDIQCKAVEWFGHTITLGISSAATQVQELPQRLMEAMELIKHRMIEGNGRIIKSQHHEKQSKKYVYPAHSERRIVNYIQIGDMDSIVTELDAVREQIAETEGISYDNIMFIYNQLMGATIKYLNEQNINTSAIFADKGNVYSTMASMDTLDELNAYLKGFYFEISKYLSKSNSEDNYLEKILTYLDEHYNKEIVFEDMAKEIGISYSYMRKLVYEGTGKSLIDYMNHKRIQAAKQLLIRSTLNVAQIATEVGYNNIQSFNRFFRKYEGITPSSYKYSKLNG